MKAILNIAAALVFCALTLPAGRAAGAAPPFVPPAAAPLQGCAPDAVQVGPTCVDKYEASVWSLAPVAAAAKPKLVAAIKGGTVTKADLDAAGAVQFGLETSFEYPCNLNGNDCTDIYAVSIPGVVPSGFATWFQAIAAARNSGKRLLFNHEWQMAAFGTPDPGASPGPNDCNTNGFEPANTGSRSNCVSSTGVFDMVGNVSELMADLTAVGRECRPPIAAGDINCLTDGFFGPFATIRGGNYTDEAFAGVFAMDAQEIMFRASWIGFRCAR